MSESRPRSVVLVPQRCLRSISSEYSHDEKKKDKKILKKDMNLRKCNIFSGLVVFHEDTPVRLWKASCFAESKNQHNHLT